MVRITRMLFAAAVLVAALVVAGCGGGSAGTVEQDAPNPDTATVSIRDKQFYPPAAKVSPGGSVTWTNDDLVSHNVTGDGGLESGEIANGDSYTHEFPEEGIFKYTCTAHEGESGMVVVEK